MTLYLFLKIGAWLLEQVGVLPTSVTNYSYGICTAITVILRDQRRSIMFFRESICLQKQG